MKLDHPATRQSLTVSKLLDGRWLELGTYGSDEKVRAEPFEAIEIELSSWWEAVEAGSEDDDTDEAPSGP